MVYLGIDVAKDKHDCYIVNSDGEILANVFTIPNDQAGFNLLFQKLQSVAPDLSKVKVGLEATGHYSYNILGFLLDNGLHTYVINPLHVNLFRKASNIRKMNTDLQSLISILIMQKTHYSGDLKSCLINTLHASL